LEVLAPNLWSDLLEDNNIEILGLKNCDKCREAQKKLNELGYEARLIDVRQNPITFDDANRLISLFGDRILNKRSATFRGLSELEKDCSVIELLKKYPALMKRPVIVSSTSNTIGWTTDTANEWCDRSVVPL
jgi:arsenate reductase-like glutaredoxin family protein